jgi:bifunctional ADP-heptose synthase (sugar kinase/adenylyltransferase)
MTLYTRTETLHEPATNRAPVDVSGAGEATLAAYAAALAKGYEVASCLRFASRAAGIAIGAFGTVVCKQEEVFSGVA